MHIAQAVPLNRARGGSYVAPLLLVALLVAATGYLALMHRQIYPNIPDSIGYRQASLQLAAGRGLAYQDAHNRPGASFYTLHTFKVIRAGISDRSLDYPPGLPAIAAFLIRLTGDPDVVSWTVPLLAALLVLAVACLGTVLYDPWAGLWSALTLVATLTFWSFGTALWSEIPSATLLYIGLTCYAAASCKIHGAAVAPLLAGIGGLLLGSICFARFANLSILPAAAFMAFALSSLQEPRSWRLPAIFLACVLAIVVALLTFNTFYYGGPFTTAYSPRHGWYTEAPFALQYAFGKSFVGGASAVALGRMFLQDFGWLLLFGFLSFLRVPRRIAVGFLGLILCLLGPYAIYAFPAQGVNSRFVLPAWPAVCLLIGSGLAWTLQRVPGRLRGGQWALRLILLGILLQGIPKDLAQLDARNQTDLAMLAQAEAIAALTEPNAVLMSYLYNDTIAVYGHRSVLNYRHMVPYDPATGQYEFDMLADVLTSEVTWLLNQGVPVYYLWDQDRSLYQSHEVLAAHFRLERVSPKYKLYRVRAESPA